MAVKQKILIVDDDNNIAELISLYLTKECYDTKIVNDGEQALIAFVAVAAKSLRARICALWITLCRIWSMTLSCCWILPAATCLMKITVRS